MISVKLDSLMNITKTTNTALAVSIGVVPSYISKVRNGTRKLANNPELIKEIAKYFSRLELTPFQKKSAAYLLSIDEFPQEPKDVEKLLSLWLIDKNISKKAEGLKKQRNAESYGNIDTYFGKKGKQEAVERFLTEIIESKTRQTLLLYSDESMDWMIDPGFFTKWKNLLRQVLENGNKIKIIHTVNRDSAEMTAAIYGWVSLYTTGLIYPYYCPQPQGKYRRTLFIAPKTGVISSQSFVDNSDKVLNLYITEQKAVEAFIKEYDDFITICKPLMQRYVKMSSSFTSLVKTCSNQKGDSYLFQPNFTGIEYPINPSGSEFYHVICLPDFKKEKSCEPVKKILSQMKSDEHYHVVISDDSFEPYSIIIKENVGVFIITSKGVPISFFFNEENLKKGFLNYVKNKIANAVISDRDAVILRLENYIRDC